MRETVDQALALPGTESFAALATLPEDHWFERKSGRIQARDLAVPLVALANAEGGYVVVGFHNGSVDPVARTNVNRIRQAARDFTEPPVKMTVVEIPAGDDTAVLLLRVESGDAVHTTVKGECYLRVGDECRRLTFAEQRELHYDRGDRTFDTRPVSATVDQLDPSLCAAYQEAIGSATVSDMLRARALLASDGRPTVAAWLLFADMPQSLFPSAHVRVLKYADRERGTGSRMTLLSGHDVRFDGPLSRQYYQAEELIRQWVPSLKRLGPNGKFNDQPMVPEAAWKEGLINAIVHRSYSMQGDHIRVEVFPNRIEITNPGRFPGVSELRDPRSVIRVARNPRVARILAELDIARELGEGIRRMFATMKEAGLADPIYQQSSMGVTLTLLDEPVPGHLRDALPPAAFRVLAAVQEARRPLSTTEVDELVGVARPTAIKYLRLLRDHRLVAWTGESLSDPSATWRLS